MRRSLIIIGLFIYICQMYCYTLTGRVADSNTGESLIMVAVQLYALPDSSFVTGAQTDDNGLFTLPKLSQGKYIIRLSTLGYNTLEKNVSLDGKDLNVGTLRLKEQVQELSAVHVTGKAAEMTVKGDTLEYNTAAYQLNENSVVEDLLKKMAGVEISSEGAVTINGETITAVKIDGKKFFGDDVQMATKNIPANMIDKIQVVDEKSDMAKLTGFEDDNTERIINLKLKEDRKKGVFGNYTGALGTDFITDDGTWFNYKDDNFFKDDFRYNGNIFTNILSGNSQTTIVGGGNNTNEIRTGRGRGPFGSQNQGITRSENVGVNTNIDASKRVDGLLIGGDAQMTHSNNDTRTQQDKTTYGDETIYMNHDTTNKTSKVWDAKLRLEFEWTIDTLNTLFIKPNISYTNSKNDSYNRYLYYKDTTTRINDGYQDKYSTSEDISADVKVTYNRKFAQKKGRSVTIDGKFSFTNTKGFSETYSFNNLSNRSLIDQYTNSGNNNFSYSLQVSYIEPLSASCQHLLETKLTYAGNNRSSHKDQYSMDDVTNDYTYDSTYSNSLKNSFSSEKIEFNYRYLSEHSDLTVGVLCNPSQTHTKSYYADILNRDTTLNVVNWSPNVSFKYKFGKKQFARVIYRGSNSQPTITQMEPVRNNSDAMSETVGNLGLKPSFTHRVRVMFSRFNEKKFSNIMTGIRANITQNAFVNNSIYDEQGKVYSQTVNAKTTPWNINGDFMYNTPLAKKMFQFHTRTSVSYRSQTAYVLREQPRDTVEKRISDNSLLLGNKTYTNNVSLNEGLMLRFTHNVADIGVRGDFTYSYTHNTLSGQQTNVYNWSITGDVQFHLPKKWTISADCGYTDRYGYGKQLGNVSEVLFNVSIEKSWGPATLALKGYDLLNQRKNVVQVVGADYVKYEKYNTLPTYCMLTFTYKLNKMGGLKATGRAGFMQSMYENNGRPLMGPPGPPPGH